MRSEFPRVRVCLSSLLLWSSAAFAADALRADASHHSLDFQNECVRVVRGHFEPGARSDDFFDAKGVAVVALGNWKSSSVVLPDGKKIELPPRKAGETWWAPPGRIALENTSDGPLDFVVIEPQSGCKN